MFLGGPKERKAGEPSGRKQLRAREGEPRGLKPSTSSPSQSLLAASEDIAYNGVVCMRKRAFLPLDELQRELKVSEKSGFRLAPVGARSGS